MFPLLCLWPESPMETDAPNSATETKLSKTFAYTMGGCLVISLAALGATFLGLRSCSNKLIDAISKGSTVTQTTNVWTLVEGKYPSNKFIVCEENINEEFKEHWKNEPPWWQVPFGNWPGEAIVRLKVPARVLYSVPLNVDWQFRRGADGVVEVTVPAITVEAVEIQTEGIGVFYDKTAAVFYENQMEDKLRRNLLAGMRERSTKRIPSQTDVATKAIEKFVRDFLLTRIIDAPVTAVVVRFSEPKIPSL